MNILALSFITLATIGHSSGTWCVCKEGLSDVVLQKTLDYACGAGADCVPTHPNEPCFQPNTVKSHCSFAVNSFFQRKAQAPGSCDFSATAIISPSDPSYAACSFPSTVSGAGTTASTPVLTTPTTSPVTDTPTTTTPVTTPTTSPYSTTPTNSGTTPTTGPYSTTPTTGPYSTTPITGATPFSTTPNTGGLGGFGNGLGPSGDLNADYSRAASGLLGRGFTFLWSFLFFSFLAL